MSTMSIKDLDWVKQPRYPGSTITGDLGGVHLSVTTVAGKYDIHSFDEDKTFFVFMPDEPKRQALSLATARLVAQSHFAARIMSAFVEEPRP